MFVCQQCLRSNNFISRSTRLKTAFRDVTRPNAYAYTTWRLSVRATSHVQHVSKVWRRGAKTRSSVRITGLPQGVLPEGTPAAVEEPEYPELLLNVRGNMEKFAHCVLLTRVGNFYEMYFGQAEMYGPLLSLKVGKRSIGQRSKRQAVAMAGFPYFQLDRYLKILVKDLSKHVAIVEEFDQGKDMPKDRRIARVITPGTLIDENFMDPFENNYLLSIQLDHARLPNQSLKKDQRDVPSTTDVGLAWLDLSSGDFFTQRTGLRSLSTMIARIAPKEILLDASVQDSDDSRLTTLSHAEQHRVTFVPSMADDEHSKNWLAAIETCDTLPDTPNLSGIEKTAAIAIVRYVKTQLQGKQPQLLQPIQRQDDDLMALDKNTLRALEIRETIRDGSFQGSLLHSVRRTSTKSGARLLSQRLSAPSMSLEEINSRLDLVSELIAHSDLHENATRSLRDTFDSLRLLQKFSFGRGDADDLLSLSRTIQVTASISQYLHEHCERADPINTDQTDQNVAPRRLQVRSLLDRLVLEGPMKLSRRITNTIDEEKLMEQHRIEDQEAAQIVERTEEILIHEGEAPLKGVPQSVRAQLRPELNGKSTEPPLKDTWIMQRNATPSLAKLHNAFVTLRQEEGALQEDLQSRLGPAVTLRWTPGLGHICHVKGAVKSRSKELEEFLNSARLVRSSKSTQSYHLPHWTQLGGRIDDAKLRIQAEENRIFADLRAQVIRNLVSLRRNASVLDELDVACSFATLAREQSLVRPILNNSTDINIVGGRHATVEGSLTKQGRNFTSNNCLMSDKERILLITGPNMGGKSTFLRQNALIAILAQTGSYVPAEYAEIGLIDKIFSRVGSADNLYQHQSTFMVEMLETADILKEATERSFVIMDEVGRGTTPEDGIAVGFAALHHLHQVNKSRVLFATHFHALTDMMENAEGVSCYCTDVQDEVDGSWTFVHRLRPGVNRCSHAIRVAELAGLPNAAIKVAAQVLDHVQHSPTSEPRWPRLKDLKLD